jgi:hypothetical protein
VCAAGPWTSASAGPPLSVDRSTYYGGSGTDTVRAVVLAPGGDFILGGTSSSAAGIATPGSWMSMFAGTHEVGVVARFDSAGKRVWGTYYGDAAKTGFAHVTAVAVGPGGFIHIAGSTTQDEGIATPGTFKPTHGFSDSIDMFLARLSPDGAQRLWGTYYGGFGSDFGFALAIDAQGRPVLVGSTSTAEEMTTVGAFQEAKPGAVSGVVAVFSTTGQIVEATYFGAPDGMFSATTDILDVAIDPLGRIVVTGLSDGTVPTTPGVHQANNAGGQDGFVAVFDGLDTLAWSTMYGGPGYEMATRVVVDAQGAVYVGGETKSSSGLATPGAYKETVEFIDAFVAKFDGAGKRQWGTLYGGEGIEDLSGLAVTGAGNVVLAGQTESKTAMASPEAFQSQLSGYSDNYVAELDAAGATRIWGTYSGGPGSEQLWDVVRVSPERVVVGGYTGSSDGVATPLAHQTIAGGGLDGYLTMIRTAPAHGCTGDDDCDGGPCVDGFCCDAPCGGGSDGDCQACSEAMGALLDGVCDPVPGFVCRPQAGECDVAEACAGVETSCPIDQFVPDGTPCADGTCQVGVCEEPMTTTADGSTGETSGGTTEAGESTTDVPGTGGTTGEATTSSSGTTGGEATTGSTGATDVPTGGATSVSDSGASGSSGSQGPDSGELDAGTVGCACGAAPTGVQSGLVGLLGLLLRRRRRCA